MLTERENSGAAPEGVQVIPTQPEIPKHLEAKDGVQVVSQQPASIKISDTGSGSQTNTANAPTLQLPADQQTLTRTVKKGNIKDATTWLAAFWLRMIKKAIHFGWKIKV